MMSKTNNLRYREEVSHHMQRHLRLLVPTASSLWEVYQYALFPAGKLFRPLLALYARDDFNHQSSAQDKLQKNFYYLTSFLEFHHVYSLLHDDLPCMDNDDFRRNRPATHKQFGEWQALLSGDGLLNASYALLGKIQHPQHSTLWRLALWCLGPKGLIEGQAMDLSQQINQSLPDLLRTHELKTARLMQFALLAGLILCSPGNQPAQLSKDLFRLGRALGLSFQLLDDLMELHAPTLSAHERSINPFLTYGVPVFSLLQNYLTQGQQLMLQYQLNHVASFIEEYLSEVLSQLDHHRHAINIYLSPQCRPKLQQLLATNIRIGHRK